MSDFQPIVNKIKSMYGEDRNFIPLHEPKFAGNEKKYLIQCIDSTFVSSVGEFVNEFEAKMKALTGAKYAIAVVNGTAALHLSLELAGVKEDDIVVTQAVSFVATANAIKYTRATPYFIDIDLDTLGMSPSALREFFKDVIIDNGIPIHKPTGKRVGAIVPMHTFGFPTRIDEIVDLAKEYKVPVIEDAAESIGSTYKGKQTGTFGLLGTYSFNGNKTITCGGGGIIVTNDDKIGVLAKHLSTQAKKPHAWNFDHDMIGYNYRCPNINSALACAQLEQLESFLENKRKTADEYKSFFENTDIEFIDEPKDSKSNFWLNAILLKNRAERDEFLKFSNENGVMTRPIWTMLNKLDFLQDALSGSLTNSQIIEDRLVNIPSSVR